MRRLALAVAALMLLPGCGGSQSDETAPEPVDPITAIQDGLKDIASGRIEMVVRALTPNEQPISFEMSGTFAAATSEESLPIADLKYTNRSGVKPQESSFVSDGERAWVINSRGTKEVEGAELDELRGGRDVGGLSTLEPKTWFDGPPQQRPGEVLEGAATTTYTGELDAFAVIENVVNVSANLGAYVLKRISPADAERIRAAARNPSLELVAGTEDDLLRSVRFGVDLEGDAEALRGLRELAANRIEFDLTLTEVNETVPRPKVPEGAAV